MNLLPLECPNCGSNLELDLDNLQSYCSYCGEKLLLDMEQIQKLLSEKEKTKQAQEETKQAEEKTKQEREHTEQIKATADSTWKEQIPLVIAILGSMGFIAFMSWIGSM